MPTSKSSILTCLAIAFVTAAVYLRVATFDFVPFDDREYVAENLRVHAGLTAANIRWALTTDYFSNWHPLTWLSYMLDCELFGPRPGPIHLVNVAWHVANSVLLFLVLRRMTASAGSSAVVAFLFALHPLHVESVAWVSERKDVLSGFFFILTMAAYAAYVRRPSWRRYLLTALSLFLGLMAKPMLVTMPCVLLLLDYWPLNRLEAAGAAPGATRRRCLKLLAEKIPLFGVVAISCVLTFLAQLSGRSVGNLDVLPITARLANAGIAFWTYIGNTIWPTKLAAFYPHPGFTPVDDPAYTSFLIRGAVALGALIASTVVIVWFGRKHRYLTVGWLWFLGTLVPVIGLVQVGTQGLADRYTYIPLIGLFIMAAWGVPDLLRNVASRRLWLDATSVAVILACIALTWVQIGHWRNGVTLFSHNMAVNPHPRAEQLLAVALARAGRHAEAVEIFAHLAEIRPNEPAVFSLYAVSLQLAGRKDEALEKFRRSIELDPLVAKVHYNFANLLAEVGQLDAAVDEYEKTLRLERLPTAHNNFGAVLMRQQKYAEAAQQFMAALEISPVYAGARRNLELLLADHPEARPRIAADGAR